MPWNITILLNQRGRLPNKDDPGPAILSYLTVITDLNHWLLQYFQNINL